MPEHDPTHDTTPAIDSASSFWLLAKSQKQERRADLQAHAELSAAFEEFLRRMSRKNQAAIRLLQLLAPMVVFPLARCAHVTRVCHGATGEYDQSFPCCASATVHNLADDADYCLCHHQQADQKAEATR